MMGPDESRSGARALFDLLRSELKRAWSRRGIRIAAVLAFAGLLLLSGNNHKAVSDARASFEVAEAKLSDPGSFEKSKEAFERNDFEQATPYFGDQTEDQYQENLEFQSRFSSAEIRQQQVDLHPEFSYLLTLGFFGTVPGVVLAVLAVSTFAGAEFRWGYWKTAASHEPRRSRLVLGKIVAVWIILALALAALLALSYPVNAVAAQIYDLNDPVPVSEHVPEFIDPYTDPIGPPDFRSLLREYGVALLTLGFYSTLAFAAVAWSRATLAGPVASLGILGLEGALTNAWLAAKHVVPAQQLAFLRSEFIDVNNGATASGVWYEPLDRLHEFGADVQMLSDIPDWRALLVLLSWTGLVVLASVLALRSRDIPG